MSGSELNKEYDKINKLQSKLTDEFIAAGRGHELPSVIRHQTDPLSIRHQELNKKYDAVRSEMQLRYGPSLIGHLPKGFGPRKFR